MRRRNADVLGVLLSFTLLAMCLLLTIAVGKKFLSASNLISVIRQFSFYGILAIGMCMVMVWSMMVQGILVGLVGILLLLCLIPLVKGIQ